MYSKMKFLFALYRMKTKNIIANGENTNKAIIVDNALASSLENSSSREELRVFFSVSRVSTLHCISSELSLCLCLACDTNYSISISLSVDNKYSILSLYLPLKSSNCDIYSTLISKDSVQIISS